jgi:RHS repeat-associated protein
VRERTLGEGTIRILPDEYFDKETGLAINYFRDYGPQTGRYLQSDPIGLAGGINPFSYANNDPLRFLHPLGLAAPGKEGLRGLGKKLLPKLFGESINAKIALACANSGR